MNRQPDDGVESAAPRLSRYWARHGDAVMRLAVAGMAITAAVWLGYEFFRLLFQPDWVGWHRVARGGIDLAQRQHEIGRWFGGRQVYGFLGTATYPPASYLIMWPLLGWLGPGWARWLWAGTSVVALVWLIRIVLRESLVTTRRERVFWALVPLSTYATGATIGNGQLAVHIVPLLLASLLVLRDRPPTWRRDLIVAVLMSLALVKPSVSAPFVWLVAFCRRPMRPVLLLLGVYGGLTLAAALFQPGSIVSTMRAWADWSGGISTVMALGLSQSNLHAWLDLLGLARWTTPVSLAVLLALGLWTWRHRVADTWILAGVTGLVARLWTYHGWYDDLVILPAMIALHRLAKQGATPNLQTTAGLLLAILLAVMIAPGGQYLLPIPWRFGFGGLQALIWVAVLAYLARYAWRATDHRPRMAGPRSPVPNSRSR